MELHSAGHHGGIVAAPHYAAAEAGRDILGEGAHAREGYVVTRSQARLTSEKLAELNDVPGFASMFLSEGKAPAEGAVLRQAALADTIDHLAHVGLDDFYRGDVGREMAADLERIG